jgi:NAD(P)-dependent dehydrogenase (short-subunit alcohol dehydrogenase family)
MSKVILVTGVTKGCGRALALGFAGLGHVVLGCGRNRAALDALRGEIGDAHDLSVVDLADDGQVASWTERAFARHGTPDLVVNNAGLINRNAPLWEVPAEEFSSVVDVNVKGVFHVLRHVLPAMIARGSGVVVNFTSGWGRSTAPEVAPYCATKWALEGLTQALAQELPRGIAAVPVNPGIIHTEMLESCFGQSAASYPSPAEWAKRAVPWLLALGTEHSGRPLSCP